MQRRKHDEQIGRRQLRQPLAEFRDASRRRTPPSSSAKRAERHAKLARLAVDLEQHFAARACCDGSPQTAVKRERAGRGERDRERGFAVVIAGIVERLDQERSFEHAEVRDDELKASAPPA